MLQSGVTFQFMSGVNKRLCIDVRLSSILLPSLNYAGLHNHFTLNLWLYCIFLDPPQEFSSENLGDPEISFKNDEEVEVTLLCKVKVLNGIGNWRNVSYKVEWFAEGVSLLKEEICGGLPKGEVNAQPCPGNAGEFVSRLLGKEYRIGQWVRS